MAITLGSIFAVGKVVSPLIGGAIRLIGGKKHAKKAVAVEAALNRNPKTLTATLTSAVVALLYWKFPEQAAAIVEWATTHGPQILEGLSGGG